VQISIINDPVVAVSIDNASICEGGTSTYSAAVTGGIGSPSYQWQYNDPILGWTDLNGETNQTLEVTYNTAGTYEHRAVVAMSVGCNGVSDGLVLTVNTDPDITITANESEVCIGAFVFLSATVTGGSNQLMYHWQSSPDGTSNWTDIGTP